MEWSALLQVILVLLRTLGRLILPSRNLSKSAKTNLVCILFWWIHGNFVQFVQKKSLKSFFGVAWCNQFEEINQDRSI